MLSLVLPVIKILTVLIGNICYSSNFFLITLISASGIIIVGINMIEFATFLLYFVCVYVLFLFLYLCSLCNWPLGS
jgi:hypothetical protein